MKTFLQFIAGASLLVLTSSVGAEELMTLSNAQMDSVNAGAISFVAIGNADAQVDATGNQIAAGRNFSAVVVNLSPGTVTVAGLPPNPAAVAETFPANSVFARAGATGLAVSLTGPGIAQPASASVSQSASTASIGY